MKAWRAKYPHKAAYAQIRNSASRRKIVFAITLEQFVAIIEGTRYLCEKGTTKYSYQLDRKNANLGYEWGNLQIITCSENATKGNLERRKGFVAFFQDVDDTNEDPF